MGQGVLFIIGGPHGGRRTIRCGETVLRKIFRHIAGHAALRALAAAEEHQRQMGQQPLCHRLLPRGKKAGAAEDLTVCRMGQLIINAGQQQTVLLGLRRCRDAALFVHETVSFPALFLLLYSIPACIVKGRHTKRVSALCIIIPGRSSRRDRAWYPTGCRSARHRVSGTAGQSGRR